MNVKTNLPVRGYLRTCREQKGLSLRAAGDLLAAAGWSKSGTAAKERLHRLEHGGTGQIKMHELPAMREVLGCDPYILTALYLGEVNAPEAWQIMDRALSAWAWLHFDRPGVLDAYRAVAASRGAGGELYHDAIVALDLLRQGVARG